MAYVPPFDLMVAIDALEERCGFHSIRSDFARAGKSAGSGWKGLRDKLDPKNKGSDELSELLVRFYKSQLLLGSKAVEIFTDSKQENWKDWFENATRLKVPLSQYSSAYPLPLKTGSLTDLDSKPTLVEICNLSNSALALLFCSPRSFQIASDIPLMTHLKVLERQLGTLIASLYSMIFSFKPSTQ